VKDVAGNETTMGAPSAQFTIDNETPTVGSVTFKADQAGTRGVYDSGSAADGDTVQLRFTMTDGTNPASNLNAPVVTMKIGTTDVTLTSEDVTAGVYTGTYTVQPGDNGAMSYSVTLSNKAGTSLASPVTGGGVTADNLPLIVGNPSGDPTIPEASSVNFTVSEPTSQLTVSMFGNGVSPTGTGPYEATATWTSGNPYTIVVTAVDLTAHSHTKTWTFSNGSWNGGSYSSLFASGFHFGTKTISARAGDAATIRALVPSISFTPWLPLTPTTQAPTVVQSLATRVSFTRSTSQPIVPQRTPVPRAFEETKVVTENAVNESAASAVAHSSIPATTTAPVSRLAPVSEAVTLAAPASKPVPQPAPQAPRNSSAPRIDLFVEENRRTEEEGDSDGEN